MTPTLKTLSNAQLARIRRDTPGLKGRLNLDNAGSSFMATPVIERMKAALEQDVLLGGYVAQEQQQNELDDIYPTLAALFGGLATDYAVVGSAVDGWTKAFYSLPLELGDNIVTAYTEYCANYVAYLQLKEKRGVEIRVARMAAEGGVDLEHLESLVDANTKLISITHMPSSSGEIVDVAAVGRIARKHDILFQLDACQSAGHIPLNVNDLGCDIMTGTARKFLRGPRGIGFLYVNERARQKMEPIVLTNQSAAWVQSDKYDLRSDTRVFEAWERSVVNQLGFKAALDYYQNIGVKEAGHTLLNVADYLRSGLAVKSNVSMTCPHSARSAIITFNLTGLSPEDVKMRMEGHGISTQIASVNHTRLDLEARQIDKAVRVSPHYYTTSEDVDRFLDVLDQIQA